MFNRLIVALLMALLAISACTLQNGTHQGLGLGLALLQRTNGNLLITANAQPDLLSELDPATGATMATWVWPGHFVQAAADAGGDHVAVTGKDYFSNSFFVALIELAPAGQVNVVWEDSDTDHEDRTAPVVVADGWVIFGGATAPVSDTGYYAGIDLAGQSSWRVEAGIGRFVDIAVGNDGEVVVADFSRLDATPSGGYDVNLNRINPTTGEVIWQRPVVDFIGVLNAGSELIAPVVTSGRTVGLKAYTLADGTPTWSWSDDEVLDGVEGVTYNSIAVTQDAGGHFIYASYLVAAEPWSRSRVAVLWRQDGAVYPLAEWQEKDACVLRLYYRLFADGPTVVGSGYSSCPSMPGPAEISTWHLRTAR